jgi:enamine deaminase RidA (YjgF/YER057c/UK114 family)
MIRKAISTNTAPPTLGPYSQAIVANGFVFCSGTVGMNLATGSPGGDRFTNNPATSGNASMRRHAARNEVQPPVETGQRRITRGTAPLLHTL